MFCFFLSIAGVVKWNGDKRKEETEENTKSKKKKPADKPLN